MLRRNCFSALAGCNRLADWLQGTASTVPNEISYTLSFRAGPNDSLREIIGCRGICCCLEFRNAHLSTARAIRDDSIEQLQIPRLEELRKGKLMRRSGRHAGLTGRIRDRRHPAAKRRNLNSPGCESGCSCKQMRVPQGRHSFLVSSLRDSDHASQVSQHSRAGLIKYRR
jgi:hypothetical protein